MADVEIIDPYCDPDNPIVVTFDQVTSAAYRIKSGIRHTECIKSEHLSNLLDMEIYIKKEFLQATGSFKERGARFAMLMMSPEMRSKGIVAASAGNHALACCYHGLTLGIPVTVFMPETAPIMKIQKCRGYKGNVIVKGNNLKESKYLAQAHARDNGMMYLNGYDHAHVLAGQGTIGLEVWEQIPGLEAVIVPVGGGGLLGGISVAIKGLDSNIKVIGVEPERAACLTGALKAGSPVDVPVGNTLADGLAVAKIGINSFATIKENIDRCVTVKEQFIALSILRLVEFEKSIVEGAGATTLAAILQGSLPELRGKKVCLVLSGGNIDTTMLGRVLDRGLAADGRLVKVKVTVLDRCGGLGGLVDTIGDLGVTIREITHERAWIQQDLSCVEVKVVCECRDKEHSLQLRDTLAAKYGDMWFNGLPYPPGRQTDEAGLSTMIAPSLVEKQSELEKVVDFQGSQQMGSQLPGGSYHASQQIGGSIHPSQQAQKVTCICSGESPQQTGSMHPSQLPGGSLHPSQQMGNGSMHPSQLPGGSFHPSQQMGGGSMHPSQLPGGSFHPSQQMGNGSIHPSQQMGGSMHPSQLPGVSLHPSQHMSGSMQPSVKYQPCSGPCASVQRPQQIGGSMHPSQQTESVCSQKGAPQIGSMHPSQQTESVCSWKGAPQTGSIHPSQQTESVCSQRGAPQMGSMHPSQQTESVCSQRGAPQMGSIHPSQQTESVCSQRGAPQMGSMHPSQQTESVCSQKGAPQMGSMHPSQQTESVCSQKGAPQMGSMHPSQQTESVCSQRGAPQMGSMHPSQQTESVCSQKRAPQMGSMHPSQQTESVCSQRGAPQMGSMHPSQQTESVCSQRIGGPMLPPQQIGGSMHPSQQICQPCGSLHPSQQMRSFHPSQQIGGSMHPSQQICEPCGSSLMGSMQPPQNVEGSIVKTAQTPLQSAPASVHPSVQSTGTQPVTIKAPLESKQTETQFDIKPFSSCKCKRRGDPGVYTTDK